MINKKFKTRAEAINYTREKAGLSLIEAKELANMSSHETLRDEFAKHIVSSLIIGRKYINKKHIVKVAYQISDLMLEERKK